MTTDLIPLDNPRALDAAASDAAQNPAAVYLTSLAPGSRRTMREALNVIANIASGGQADARTLAWAALRYQHVAAIRARLAERYAPATANKVLSALRRVLLEARRLGQMTPNDYAAAVDVANVKGTRLPKGVP